MGDSLKFRFAGFVISYERPKIILDTLQEIFNQTLVPEKLYVIDNSESEDVKVAINQLGDLRIKYYRVGDNIGPAGAASIGLKLLTNEGYQWIYWGDDDNPPVFNDSFEILLGIVEKNSLQKAGIVGAVGHAFNRVTGNIERTPDIALSQVSFLAVDSIAGGHSMIINAEVIRSGILPDEKLFFGFEELDFCLKAKHEGYNIVVSTELFLRSRKQSNRLNYEHPLYIMKDLSTLKRQYYSIRNLLAILKHNHLYCAYAYQLVKNLFKMGYGFRYGWKYGLRNFSVLGIGMIHSIMGTKNKVY